MSGNRGIGISGFERDFGNFFSYLSYLVVLGMLGFFCFVVLALFRISSFAFDTYDSVQHIPYNEVGLILGTSSLTSDGSRNQFFANRIEAASWLYQHGKIDYILVSGDNRHASYNEPRQMMNALIKAGIPKERIVADFAGFSTIDSIGRAAKVFMLRDVTIISQQFQNERALFIAHNEGMNAIGFNARDPDSKLAHAMVYIREFFARLKCILDVYILNTQPTFLGDPIAIGSTPMPKPQSNKPKEITSRPKEPGLAAGATGQLVTASVPPKEQTDSAIILRELQAARERLKQREQQAAPQAQAAAQAAAQEATSAPQHPEP